MNQFEIGDVVSWERDRYNGHKAFVGRVTGFISGTRDDDPPKCVIVKVATSRVNGLMTRHITKEMRPRYALVQKASAIDKTKSGL